MTLTKLTQDDIFARIKTTKIESLKAQLSALDSEVSRSAENMYNQGIYTSISDREKSIIEEKKILRLQLSSL